MLTIIGDGGHARVVRDMLRDMPVLHGSLAFIAIGNNSDRKREAKKWAGNFATVISLHSHVSPDATYRDGTVIMPGAIVMAGARIGRHCIINTGASVDHDCVLEDFVHIAPGAHLCGGVHVGEGALVGVGVGIEPGVKIPAWSVVKRIPYRIETCPTK